MSDSPQTIQQQINNFTIHQIGGVMALVALGDIIAALLKPTTDSDARTVTSDTLVMDVPARINAVEVTAGGVTGLQLIGGAGSTLATKQVAVAYDTDGIATITFKASDAVTAAKVTYTEWPYPTNPDGTSGLGNLLAMIPQ